MRRKVTDKVYCAIAKGEGRLEKDWNLILPRNLEAIVAHG